MCVFFKKKIKKKKVYVENNNVEGGKQPRCVWGPPPALLMSMPTSVTSTVVVQHNQILNSFLQFRHLKIPTADYVAFLPWHGSCSRREQRWWAFTTRKKLTTKWFGEAMWFQRLKAMLLSDGTGGFTRWWCFTWRWWFQMALVGFRRGGGGLQLHDVLTVDQQWLWSVLWMAYQGSGCGECGTAIWQR